MKIYSIEIQTDAGRRVVKLAAPIDVDPTGTMPPAFRSLTEVLWGVVCGVASNGGDLPKAEA